MNKKNLDLKDLRQKANIYNKKITADFVADKLGITVRSLYSKESGAKIWDEEIKTLKNLYDVSYEELESAIRETRKQAR